MSKSNASQIIQNESKFERIGNLKNLEISYPYKEGYKHSPLGLIPMDWKIKEFGKIVNLVKAKYVPKEDEHLRCIELENIDQITGSINKCVDSSLQKSTKNVFKKGQILFGKLRPYLRKYWLAEFDGVCSSEIWVLEPNQKECINEYLFRSVQQHQFIQVANVSSGSKMPRADWNLVSEYPFLLPPLPEQQKIAAILSSWEEAISKTQQLIAKLKQRNKGLMHVLIAGKKRLEEASGEWRKVNLEELGLFFKGSGISKAEIRDNGYPAIRYGEIYTTHQYIVNSFNSFINEESAKKSVLIKQGDILFTGSGETIEEIGKCVAYLKNEIAYAGGDIIIFRPKSESSRFLAYALNSDFVIKQKVSLGKGHSVVHIYPKDMSQIQIMLPSLQEQTAIANVLDIAIKEQRLYESYLSALQQQKKALMRVLLTGAVRMKRFN